MVHNNSQPDLNSGPDATSKTKAAKDVRILWRIAEIIAVVFWLSALAKVLFFDIDRYFLDSYLPNVTWILDYKFIFGLAGLAATALLMGALNTILFIVFVALYPLFLIFWRIPRFVFRKQSWNLAIALGNGAISFFRSFTYNLFVSTSFLVSFVICVVSESKWLLYPAIVVLLVLIVLTYIQSFLAVFRAPALSDLYIRVFSVVRGAVSEAAKLDAPIRTLPVVELNETQLKVRTDKLGNIVLYNRACLFLATKLKKYQRTGLNVAFGVLIVLKLIAITVLCFTAINFALYEVDPNAFESSKPTFFMFFYYSFNNLLFNSIKEISPATVFSQSLAMFENLIALVLIGLFTSLLVTIRSERHSAQLDRVITAIERDGNEIEAFMQSEYQIQSMDDALVELQRMKVSTIQILLWLTKNLR